MWPFDRKTAEPPTADPEVETKSLGDPSPELLALFAGTSIGTLSEAQALSVPAVSSAIRLISEAAATLCINVKRKDGDSEVDAPEHPAQALLNGSVNSWMSSFEFVRDLVATALISDAGGIAIVTKVRKSPREIVLYRRGTITVDYDSITDEPTFRNASTILPADTVIHLRPPFGKAPLRLAADAIGAAKAMESHAANLFANAARPGGMLKSKTNLNDSAIERAKVFWHAAFGGGANAGKTAFMPADLEFEQLALNSTDAQFLENRKYQTLEICRAFRIPPSMAYELDRATYSNSEQMGKEFLSYSLSPWLRAVEAALNRALFTPAERAAGYRVAFDEDDLTKADLTARATAASSLISSRAINPNTARTWLLDLPPYDGGETYANPHTGASQPGQSPIGGRPPEGTRNDARPA